MRKQFTILGGLAALSLTLAACGGGSATDDAEGAAPATGDGGGAEIQLSLNQTEDHPNYIALNGMTEKVKERTDGRVNITVYANAVLGEQQESIQLVSSGAVGMASISAPQMVNINKDFQVLDMPVVFDDVDHQMEVVNDMELMGDLYTSVEDSNNLTVVGGYTQGARSIYNADKPIETPADLQGMKIRVQESELQLAMVNALGGSPTPMAFGEVYTALQSGVIDGAENNEVSYVTQKHYEVAPYYSYTNHLVGVDFLVVNTDLLKGFSEEDREIFQEEYLASVDEFISLWDEQIAAAIEETKAGGAQYNEVDSAAFAEALQPVVDQALQTDTQRALFDAIRDRA
jgi:tripartite ATP-independent transporter DctP family solute receptor